MTPTRLGLMLAVTMLCVWTGAPAAADDQKFPATGQTTSYRVGDDGDIQAGATLRYRVNQNGTITDMTTGLVWEKKSADGSIHHKDIGYTWDDAFAVHVATLNAMEFAGYDDWRVPNVKELQSILNFEHFTPAVSPAFNSNCVAGCTVTTCSCTTDSFHWTSTSLATDPSMYAWAVRFDLGHIDAWGKSTHFSVRAVRGGAK